MSRDLSVSKTGESSAYENRNIRITATDNDTLLSVTNERGTKEIHFDTPIAGTLIGWNVLNNHIILFTHADYPENYADPNSHRYIDSIYLIEHNVNPGDGEAEFELIGNAGPYGNALFAGDLDLDEDHPIESIVYFETEDIQKIYWVDGKNVLRFMNFMADEDERATWNETTFDSNRAADFGVKVNITKDNAGNTRANGVVQYLLTYFNKHGQESGYVWVSDLVYLSPFERGGAADETNNNSVYLTISGLDTSFTYFRIYSVFRSSLDGETVSYLVAEHLTTSGEVVVVDDGAHLTLQDSTRLLYLGSQAVKASTITHKDQVLFLGDLRSIGKGDNTLLETLLRATMFGRKSGNNIVHSLFVDGETFLSCRIAFEYSDSGDDAPEGIADIPMPKDEGNYPYSNQLQLSSSEIMSFKGGEKYRFALKFKCADGTETDAFWIGDAENTKYPIIDATNNVAKRIVAKCTIPASVVLFLQNSPMNYKTVQLLIAEASYADRSVKAQGIVTPTMFNVWERYNRRIYSVPSWITRVRNAGTAWKHFDVVKNAVYSTGEIQCNYWESNDDKKPYYQYTNYNVLPTYVEEFEGKTQFNDIMIVYRIQWWYDFYLLVTTQTYRVDVVVIKGIAYGSNESSILSHSFTESEWYREFKAYDSSTSDEDKSGWQYEDIKDGNQQNVLYKFERTQFTRSNTAAYNHGAARGGLYTKMYNVLTQELGIPDYYVVPRTQFIKWCQEVHNDVSSHAGYYNDQYPDTRKDALLDSTAYGEGILNIDGHASARWQSEGDHNVGASYGDETPAFFKRHLMFVDENVVTLDSPELSYNAVSLDNAEYDFRIVGIAKQSSVISDYTIDATNSAVSGTNYDIETFSGTLDTRNRNIDGIVAWPIWKDYGLTLTSDAKSRESGSSRDEDERIKMRTSSDYEQGRNVVRYWMYLWQHAGSISGYIVSDDEDNKSSLRSKIYSNLRYSYNTIYFATPYTYRNNSNQSLVDSIRQVQELSGNEVTLTIGNEKRYYTGRPQISLSMPAELKYPIMYSSSRPIKTTTVQYGLSDTPYLYSTAPVVLEYGTKTHAVISLHTDAQESTYTQTILPRLFDEERISLPTRRDWGTYTTGALIPWIYDENRYNYAVVSSNYPLVVVPIFEETEYSEQTGLVSLVAWYDVEPSLVNRDPGFYVVWQDLISSFSGEDVYARVESASYYYFVMINDVERTPSVKSMPMFSIQLNQVKCIARIPKTSTEDIDVLVNVHTGSVTNLSADPEEVYETEFTVNGSASLNIRTGVLTYRTYPFRDYAVNQPSLLDNLHATNSELTAGIGNTDKYFFIGEIFKDFSDAATDTRYGGITLSAVETNRFINAGPQYQISDMNADGNDVIYANQGDTYFQRWDALRILPYSDDSVNKVLDIPSLFVETHINLDGRTDLQRGISEIASIDITKFGQLNPVYSQKNTFSVKRDLDEDFNTDVYRSSLTWTLPKADMADVDEWTHITLASSLKLDGDKGNLQALRRVQNSILAFQDRGVSEILFNSRTQLSTQDGVPVEIGNSGKVDGKRYLTNKYGVTNKWSIVEGKSGLYFVDNINKAFCAANFASGGGLAIENLSEKLGFGVWFRKNNNVNPWKPVEFNNIVSFYDKTHSDVYLVKQEVEDGEAPCLVYNEKLGVFTSFYDYGSVPMMTSVDDRFVSFKDNKLWLQNEGLYCKFYGHQYDFWTTYRVTPDPFGDKIWTNLEYRADAYRVLDSDGEAVVDERDLLDGGEEGLTVSDYQSDETFDELSVWNEYQKTKNFANAPIKKFRVWRVAIPRAIKTETNRYGLDRIRNPWINIKFKRAYTGRHDETNQDLMQLHDITVKYFE